MNRLPLDEAANFFLRSCETSRRRGAEFGRRQLLDNRLHSRDPPFPVGHGRRCRTYLNPLDISHQSVGIEARTRHCLHSQNICFQLSTALHVY